MRVALPCQLFAVKADEVVKLIELLLVESPLEIASFQGEMLGPAQLLDHGLGEVDSKR